MNDRRSNFLSLAVLLALTLAIFGDVLFAGGKRVLGHPGTDLVLQYYCWRDFGFHELARGNLALWNPYIFGGAPYFGGMQGALLYPPNFLFLLLPVAAAINWTIALNIFLLGMFMFFWMKVRGLGPVGSFFAASLVMFSGPHFLHVFAGHLPQMAAMTWAPLIFCAIDRLFISPKPGPCLLGMFAVAIQIVAGFPQYVFYTGIIAGLYSALRLIGNWNWRLAVGLLSIYVGGAMLAAVQLLSAIDATSETVRSVRVPFEFALLCGFAPENFVTLVAPNFLGEIANYWGRCYLWETSLFFSVTGLLLAIHAAIHVEWKIKWVPLIVIFAALLLALGDYTPLFAILYAHVPGFDRFRATAKFIFPAVLFLILLAATELDRLLKRKRVETKFVAAVFAGGAALGLAGLWTANTASWQSFMNKLHATGESYLKPQLYQNADFVAHSQHAATMSILLAAGICIGAGTLLALSKRDARALYGIVVLGIAEIFYFAYIARPTFDGATIINPEEAAFLREHPGDYRIINPLNPNTAMSLRVPDIWGYDPNVVRRYSEFITWTQGGDPDAATLYVRFTHFDPLYVMLRLRYVFGQQAKELQVADSPMPAMPHLQLISNYRLLQNRAEIFDALRSGMFDPTREVILESEPQPKPVPGEDVGEARIVASSTDWLTIEADAPRPSILLITDVYTPSWRAVALSGSAQRNYQLLPANYILRAIPLAAGHHRLRVEYAPRGFVIGKWISIFTSVLLVASFIWIWTRKALP